MYREIRKKKLILENRKPYRDEVSQYLARLNLLDWIYSSMRLSGSALTRDEIEYIMDGGLIQTAELDEHTIVGRYRDTIRMAQSMVEMGIELDETYFLRFYDSLAEPEHVCYRESNLVMDELDYYPPDYSEVREQMEILVRWNRMEDCLGNPLMKAVCLHNKLMEIYPFGKDTGLVARMALLYELMKAGYPPVLLNLNEEEYFETIRHWLWEEDGVPLFEALCRAVYNKLEIMLQLTEPED